MSTATGFATFRTFTDPVLAETLAGQLQAAGIAVQLRDESSPIDPLLTGQVPDDFIALQLAPADFSKAQAFLEEHYRQQLHLLPADYYLFEFSTEELREVIEKPDEWNPLDYVLAQRLLNERGEAVTAPLLEARKSERIRALAQPRHIGGGWRVLLWIAALIYSLPTLLLGLLVQGSRRTLPDGNRVYMYDAPDRRFGLQLAVFSGMLFGLQLLAVVFGVRISLLSPWSFYLTDFIRTSF